METRLVATPRRSRRRARLLAPLFAAFIPVVGLACADPEAPADNAAPGNAPNLLLIVIDTLRWDQLGVSGSPRDTTPALDALAADATRFARAYATAPWTQPSVASMLTGLAPGRHGVTQLGSVLPPGLPTLSSVLADAGYHTAGIVSHFLLSEKLGFDRGFQQYAYVLARGNPHRLSTAGRVTRAARAELRRLVAQGRPFFLFVHFFDPHSDYLRHPEIGFAPPRAGRLDGSETIEELRALKQSLTPSELGFLRALYAEEIRHTDDAVGKLVQTLKRLDLYDATVIAVTADHGEEFMGHGGLTHGHSLYDELVRVPLIVRVPGSGSRGRIVDTAVSLVSLMPTLLDLLGVPAPDLALDGPSLAPLIEGRPPAEPAAVLAEVDFDLWDAHKRALVTERFKLIRDEQSGAVELYDLASDPGERRDLAAARPELVAELLPRLGSGRPRTAGEGEDGAPAVFSAEEIEKLRALGYVEEP